MKVSEPNPTIRHVAIVNNTSIYIQRFRREFITSLVQAGLRVTLLCPPDAASDKLLDLGATIVPIPLQQHGTHPRSELRAFGALLRHMRQLRPDLVINFTLKPSIYGSLAARAAGARTICSVFTGLGYYFTEQSVQRSASARIIRGLLRLALPFNRRVVFQNADDRDLLVHYGLVRPERTAIVPGSGVNLERFQSQPVPRGAPTFLLVGRMLVEKGVREFVQAAHSVRQRHPQARFWLLGGIDGSSSAIPRAELEAWVKQGIVEWPGEVDDVRGHIAAASVVVLPSYREGLPRSVLEAMAVGRAVVATDVPGCRETVVAGRNGYLVPVRDSAALAVAMEKLIADPALVECMGRESLALVRERFEVHAIAAQLRAAVGL
jgi:glycosyltransferase involved in cell wall biosynthesis